MPTETIRNQIHNIIGSIIPNDKIEQEHITDIKQRISSGSDMFRIQKDAIPPKHLVSFSVVIDPDNEKILLFDHKKALLLLPSGGHINVDELPLAAAQRELQEELGMVGRVYTIGDQHPSVPFFITVDHTVGISEKHIDVSLWYLFLGDSNKELSVGSEYHEEFDGYYWMDYATILATPVSKFNPNFHRFIHKIQTLSSK